MTLAHNNLANMNSPNKNILTNSDFFKLHTFAQKRIGIILSEHKKEKLSYYMFDRIKFLNLTNVTDYVEYLERHADEEAYFINYITNTSTQFFRDEQQFEMLKNVIIPDIMQRHSKIRIWSAGCASGEEPYSIAMSFFELNPNLSGYDVKILATDVNTDVLLMGQKGIYNKKSLEKLGDKLKWFDYVSDNNMQYHINRKIQSLVSFKALNLLDKWPMQHHFDVIFFRNVAIYMSKEASDQILNRFNAYLENGSYLVLGPTESISHYLQDHYTALGHSIYRKKQKTIET